MKRSLFLACLLTIPFSIHAQQKSAKDMYYEAFSNDVRLTFSIILAKDGQYGKPGDPAFNSMVNHIVSGMTRCHAEGMENFDSKHVEKAYEVVAKGGSYADATRAFNLSLAADAAEGGPAKDAVERSVKNSVEQGQGCVAGVMASATSR